MPHPTFEQIVAVNDGFTDAQDSPLPFVMLIESKRTVVQGVVVGKIWNAA